MTRYPLCVRCLAKGRTEPSTVAHHIEEIAGYDDPKCFDWTNIEALCRDCHERHHGRVKQ
ncbi:MAG: HNH endonuclease [Planctomycetes bacterium]|nr:HNH endonuclease [Planctomycetota bacterium]